MRGKKYYSNRKSITIDIKKSITVPAIDRVGTLSSTAPPKSNKTTKIEQIDSMDRIIASHKPLQPESVLFMVGNIKSMDNTISSTR
jgi:hypothetical protein